MKRLLFTAASAAALAFSAAFPVTAATATPSATGKTASPEKVLKTLAVPMVYQAPFSVWDAVHEETCEEASVLMLKGFADRRPAFTRAKMDSELLKEVAWEKQNLGYFESSPASDVARLAKAVYDLDLQILPLNNAADIRAQINQGRAVILPAAGRLLKNPNFKNGGPLYHMIVVKGYTKNYFITDDPGTRHGLNYRYPQARLVNAAHDWNGGQVLDGPKVMLVAGDPAPAASGR